MLDTIVIIDNYMVDMYTVLKYLGIPRENLYKYVKKGSGRMLNPYDAINSINLLPRNRDILKILMHYISINTSTIHPLLDF